MARRPLRRPPLAAAGVLLALAGCGTVKSPTEPPGPSGTPPLTFARIQSEIFTPNCVKAGCHDAATASEGLVLAAGVSYSLLVGHPASERPSLSRVDPGHPEASYLLKKIRGDADISGNRMPLDGPPFLTREQIDGIAAWIAAGAPND